MDEGGVYDVAIVGSGPAGLTAALYTARANLKTLVLGGDKWGGQLMLTTTVENYPGFPDGVQGPELMEKMKAQAERFGAKIILEDAIKVERGSPGFTVHSLRPYRARTVIIAAGADPKWLGLPNEQRLIGRGVSSCAPCDAYFFKGKKVAVVGGGDSAMEEAQTLAKFADEVTIIHRRNTFRASKIMQDRVFNTPKIKVLYGIEITDVIGKDAVEGLLLSACDPSHSPIPANPYPVDGLFVAIGHLPNSKIFGSLVDIDQKGYLFRAAQTPSQSTVSSQFTTATKTPGVFVAGDVHDYHYKQAVTAAGYGCMAAMDAERWLESQAKNP